ncbi:hypothetical protein HELRODRAFT_168554 [Helobdella robusta]|uniref:Uncharacterized protein n=1 Tax=Helobdella robusta TaxID=6412 RepID=T1F0Q1_HELRO|nr:hypothetical protein HELRODRAFT_168554 [Helobdella robusta]ESO09552.1 hypothetical protein HELRODRAFT_168554 [Helobdella robusta]
MALLPTELTRRPQHLNQQQQQQHLLQHQHDQHHSQQQYRQQHQESTNWSNRNESAVPTNANCNNKTNISDNNDILNNNRPTYNRPISSDGNFMKNDLYISSNNLGNNHNKTDSNICANMHASSYNNTSSLVKDECKSIRNTGNDLDFHVPTFYNCNDSHDIINSNNRIGGHIGNNAVDQTIDNESAPLDLSCAKKRKSSTPLESPFATTNNNPNMLFSFDGPLDLSVKKAKLSTGDGYYELQQQIISSKLINNQLDTESSGFFKHIQPTFDRVRNNLPDNNNSTNNYNNSNNFNNLNYICAKNKRVFPAKLSAIDAQNILANGNLFIQQQHQQQQHSEQFQQLHQQQLQPQHSSNFLSNVMHPSQSLQQLQLLNSFQQQQLQQQQQFYQQQQRQPQQQPPIGNADNPICIDDASPQDDLTSLTNQSASAAANRPFLFGSKVQNLAFNQLQCLNFSDLRNNVVASNVATSDRISNNFTLGDNSFNRMNLINNNFGSNVISNIQDRDNNTVVGNETNLNDSASLNVPLSQLEAYLNNATNHNALSASIINNNINNIKNLINNNNNNINSNIVNNNNANIDLQLHFTNLSNQRQSNTFNAPSNSTSQVTANTADDIQKSANTNQYLTNVGHMSGSVLNCCSGSNNNNSTQFFLSDASLDCSSSSSNNGSSVFNNIDLLGPINNSEQAAKSQLVHQELGAKFRKLLKKEIEMRKNAGASILLKNRLNPDLSNTTIMEQSRNVLTNQLPGQIPSLNQSRSIMPPPYDNINLVNAALNNIDSLMNTSLPSSMPPLFSPSFSSSSSSLSISTASSLLSLPLLSPVSSTLASLLPNLPTAGRCTQNIRNLKNIPIASVYPIVKDNCEPIIIIEPSPPPPLSPPHNLSIYNQLNANTSTFGSFPNDATNLSRTGLLAVNTNVNSCSSGVNLNTNDSTAIGNYNSGSTFHQKAHCNAFNSSLSNVVNNNIVNNFNNNIINNNNINNNYNIINNNNINNNSRHINWDISTETHHTEVGKFLNRSRSEGSVNDAESYQQHQQHQQLHHDQQQLLQDHQQQQHQPQPQNQQHLQLLNSAEQIKVDKSNKNASHIERVNNSVNEETRQNNINIINNNCSKNDNAFNINNNEQNNNNNNKSDLVSASKSINMPQLLNLTFKNQQNEDSANANLAKANDTALKQDSCNDNNHNSSTCCNNNNSSSCSNVRTTKKHRHNKKLTGGSSAIEYFDDDATVNVADDNLSAVTIATTTTSTTTTATKSITSISLTTNNNNTSSSSSSSSLSSSSSCVPSSNNDKRCTFKDILKVPDVKGEQRKRLPVSTMSLYFCTFS